MSILKSISKVLAAAIVLTALLTAAAGIVSLAGGSPWVNCFWRIASFADGILLLMIGVLLLTHRSPDKKHAPAWEQAFPGLGFLPAMLIVCVVLTAAVFLANYCAF